MARVLIVDDEPAVLLLLVEVVGEAGHDTLAAGTSEQALALARATPDVEVLLVDKNLPDGSGLDVIRQFKELRPEAEAILMTAYASLGSAIEALRLAAHDYLVKPFDDLALVTLKINNALDKVRLRRERRASDEARLHLEAELSQSRKMEALGRMASGVAHDFNNLLSVILNTTSFLLDDLPMHTGLEQAIADVQEIKRAAESGARITQQLLAFSRREVVPAVVVDVNRALEEAEAILRRAAGPSVELVVARGAGVAAVRIPAGHLEQILLNLTVNARDAMPGGGTLRIETAITPAAAAGADGGPRGVHIVVSDTGVGMTPEVQGRIFDPFFTTKGPGQGVGLGLATVYGLVQQASGSIEVRSRPGEGAVFELRFPHTDERPLVRTPAPVHAQEARGASETVLLVEDDEALRGSIRRMLHRGGYRVLDVGRGDEALALLRAGRGVDVVVTDVMMPHMTGDVLAAEVMRTQPGLPIVYMSGSLGETPDLDGFGPAFLSKPFTEGQLLAMLRRVLAPTADR